MMAPKVKESILLQVRLRPPTALPGEVRYSATSSLDGAPVDQDAEPVSVSSNHTEPAVESRTNRDTSVPEADTDFDTGCIQSEWRRTSVSVKCQTACPKTASSIAYCESISILCPDNESVLAFKIALVYTLDLRQAPKLGDLKGLHRLIRVFKCDRDNSSKLSQLRAKQAIHTDRKTPCNRV
jgi:hypothetical protein